MKWKEKKVEMKSSKCDVKYIKDCGVKMGIMMNGEWKRGWKWCGGFCIKLIGKGIKWVGPQSFNGM